MLHYVIINAENKFVTLSDRENDYPNISDTIKDATFFTSLEDAQIARKAFGNSTWEGYHYPWAIHSVIIIIGDEIS